MVFVFALSKSKASEKSPNRERNPVVARKYFQLSRRKKISIAISEKEIKHPRLEAEGFGQRRAEVAFLSVILAQAGIQGRADT